METDYLNRITIDDEICNGKPIIRGMRITVQTILEFLLAGTSEEEILHQYPVLEKADIEACRQFTILLIDKNFSLRKIAA